jgi:two-component system, LuxR family, response regulator FixJ
VLDDEPAVCQTVSLVLTRAGFDVIGCSDPKSFIALCLDSNPSCVLVDVVLNDLSGLEILMELRNRGFDRPIIMVSGRSDVVTAVRAIKEGASDFVEKPFRGNDLVARVVAALKPEESRRPVFHFPGRPPLTFREREVLFELIGGRSTKEIADRMDLSPRTVESHRVNIMQKVGAKNPAELVRLAITAKRPGT